MDGKAGKSVYGIEGEVHKRTCVSSTGLRLKK